MPLAKELLAGKLEQQATAIDEIAMHVEKDSAWRVLGSDTERQHQAWIPPSGLLLRSSSDRNLEVLGRSRPRLSSPTPSALFPSGGLVSPALCCRFWKTQCSPTGGARERSIWIPSWLTQRCAALAWDIIPLPGDVSQEQLAKIIGDMASLAFKWHKPLTARLIPAPGKKPGPNRFRFWCVQISKCHPKTCPMNA